MHDFKEPFYIVPGHILDKLLEGQTKILELLKNNGIGKSTLGDYITETEAKKLLGRKTTWFWTRRQNGMLPYSKIGATIYYSKQDLMKLLASNHSQK